MIKEIITVPGMGLEFDAAQIKNYLVEDYGEEIAISVPTSFRKPVNSVTFYFNDGSKVLVKNGQYTLTRTVEIEEGHLYKVCEGDTGKKWAAFCRVADKLSGERVLVPIENSVAITLLESDVNGARFTVSDESDFSIKDYIQTIH